MKANASDLLNGREIVWGFGLVWICLIDLVYFEHSYRSSKTSASYRKCNDLFLKKIN